MPVLFGAFPSWERRIRRRLNPLRYTARFEDFRRLDPRGGALVVPLSIADYEPLRAWSAAGEVRALIPSRAAVALCDDKRDFADWLEQSPFAAWAPRLRPPGPPYPYVWKRRRGADGRACLVVRDETDEARLNLMDPDWFAQTPVPGSREYAAHILRVAGRTRYLSTMTYDMSGPLRVKGGLDRPKRKRMEPGSPWRAQFETLLDAIGYEGLACIDYKLEEDQLRVMEINPRFGGSLAGDINRFLAAYAQAVTDR